ncbi:LGFP repeat-containing protein [Nocardia higoensis]|uniref:LGFP repeat-containing protein n=1 Tax=Nocardia higoensis TaxID=228599 RepID=UPI0002D2B0E1|nr:esterase [Nocardia higoensis]
MHHARRSAGFVAALASAALILGGCSDESDDGTAVATMTTGPIATMTSPAANMTGEPTTTAAEGGATTTAGEEANDTGDETRIPISGGGEVTVSGDIYEKFVATGGPAGALGAPLGPEESAPNGGKYQDFEGGTIYEPAEGEPHIVWGAIRQAWEDNGGAAGELGYPTSDETDIPGGKQSTFSGGTITWVDGQITVTKS